MSVFFPLYDYNIGKIIVNKNKILAVKQLHVSKHCLFFLQHSPGGVISENKTQYCFAGEGEFLGRMRSNRPF